MGSGTSQPPKRVVPHDITVISPHTAKTSNSASVKSSKTQKVKSQKSNEGGRKRVIFNLSVKSPCDMRMRTVVRIGGPWRLDKYRGDGRSLSFGDQAHATKHKDILRLFLDGNSNGEYVLRDADYDQYALYPCMKKFQKGNGLIMWTSSDPPKFKFIEGRIHPVEAQHLCLGTGYHRKENGFTCLDHCFLGLVLVEPSDSNNALTFYTNDSKSDMQKHLQEHQQTCQPFPLVVKSPNALRLLTYASDPSKSKSRLHRFEYKFAEKSQTWNEHERDAKKWGGHLTSITCKEENDLISKLLRDHHKQSALIGGRRSYTYFRKQQGANTGHQASKFRGKSFWHWSDGEIWSEYLNWSKGEPNNWQGKEWCLQAYASGGWNDIDGRHRGHAVYKRPKPKPSRERKISLLSMKEFGEKKRPCRFVHDGPGLRGAYYRVANDWNSILHVRNDAIDSSNAVVELENCRGTLFVCVKTSGFGTLAPLGGRAGLLLGYDTSNETLCLVPSKDESRVLKFYMDGSELSRAIESENLKQSKNAGLRQRQKEEMKFAAEPIPSTQPGLLLQTRGSR